MIEATTKPYSSINCCSQGPSISQALAIGFLVGIEILGFNLIPSMLDQHSAGMHFLMAAAYLSLLIMVGVYIHLLVVDPSDPRLLDKGYHVSGVDEKECELCQCKVAVSSYHCHSCGRCVEEFDHHCTFANNCIGKKNYSIFIRLVLAIIMHTSFNMGISTWLGLTLDGSYRWLAVAFGGLNFIVFIEMTVLGIFHCYISFCLFKTTLQVLKGEETKSVSIKIIKEKASNGEQSNLDLVKVNNDFGNP